MASPVQLAANRQNAAKSTGPRTRAGKARVAKNARKHGLNTPLHLDPAFNPRLPRVTELLAAGRALATAAPLAYALVELRRVKEAKATALVEAKAALAAEQPAAPALALETLAFVTALPRLERLDRYEQAIRAALRRALAASDAELAEVQGEPAAH
jgi:hypothetical protein